MRKTLAFCFYSNHLKVLQAIETLQTQNFSMSVVFVLENVKNAMTGTYHAIRKDHASRYLAEFECRFNRRFDLPVMLDRLLFIATKAPLRNVHGIS